MKSLTITRPEVLLSSLRDRLYELLSSMPILDKPELEQKALRLLRKVEMARLLDNHYVVVITGFQGVGKTTLARVIYGLPEGSLPEGVGRGEQLPVWILEDDGIHDGAFHAELVEVLLDTEGTKDLTRNNGFVEFCSRKIDRDEFIEIARNPSTHHFLLKLYVPARFFKGSSRSFLLLPGIEQKNTVWVELARHAVSCVDAAVFVTDESWARASTERALRDVEQVLEGRNLIYVLTKADQSKDRNRELAEVVMKSRNLTEEERDRIVITDPTPEADPDGDWRARLLEALDKYAAITKEARMRQVQHLRELLEEEFDQISFEVKDELDRFKIKFDEEKYQGVTAVMEVLDKEIARLRKEYSEALAEELEEHKTKAQRAFDLKIENEGWVDKAKNTFLGESIKRRRVFREWIEEAWRYPEGPSGPSLAQRHAVVLNKIVNRKLCRLNALSEEKGARPHELLGTFDTPESQNTKESRGLRQYPYEVNETVLHDLTILLKHNVQLKPSDNFKNSVRVLPVLALEAVRIGTIVPGLFDLEKRTVGPADRIREIGEQFSALKNSGSGILKGVGLMLGLDYLPDKEIDIVKDLASNVSIPTSFTPYLVAAMAASYLFVSASATVVRQDLERSLRGANAIDEIAERTHAQFLREFDRVMLHLREHVEQCLTNYFHLDQDYARLFRLNKAYRDAREAANQIKERIKPLLLG